MFIRLRKDVVAIVLLIMAIAVVTPVFASGSKESSSSSTASASGQKINLTYWWWAESDAPGANKWMNQTVAAYEKLHPNVTVNVVPQATDTLISAFTAAASAQSGPDIASQWATLPVLTQVWSGAVTAISDLVPQSEIKHWTNTNENMYNGKLWAAPMYLIGVPLAYNKALFKKAGLDPSTPITTWKQLMNACAALKSAGITPIGGGGAKASAFGAWMFAILGMQNLDSANGIKGAVLGTTSFNQPKYTQWIHEIATMISKGYFNNNIGSIGMKQGQDLFAQGKVAMAWGTDGNVLAWAKVLGADNVGVMKTPVLGSGKLATAYDTTQSTSYFVTSWSKHKEAAAKFIEFMHTKPRLESWYKITGVVPADNRFNSSQIQSPLQKKLAQFDLSPVNVWLENYIPPQMDTDGLRPAGSLLASGQPASQAITLIERTLKLWRSGNPDQVKQFKNWQ